MILRPLRRAACMVGKRVTHPLDCSPFSTMSSKRSPMMRWRHWATDRRGQPSLQRRGCAIRRGPAGYGSGIWGNRNEHRVRPMGSTMRATRHCDRGVASAISPRRLATRRRVWARRRCRGPHAHVDRRTQRRRRVVAAKRQRCRLTLRARIAPMAANPSGRRQQVLTRAVRFSFPRRSTAFTQTYYRCHGIRQRTAIAPPSHSRRVRLPRRLTVPISIRCVICLDSWRAESVTGCHANPPAGWFAAFAGPPVRDSNRPRRSMASRCEQ